MNRDDRFLRTMIEAVALNNIEQPEPEYVDPKEMATEEHKKILDWFKKYLEDITVGK